MSSYQDVQDLLSRASDLMEEAGDLLLVALIGGVLDVVTEKMDTAATEH